MALARSSRQPPSSWSSVSPPSRTVLSPNCSRSRCPKILRHCGAVELANIAEQSWSFLAERRPGTPKIRFEPLAGARGIAVLEIVNDDMPFLVDSVVGELNSRGLEIRSFVHPVFLVRRDAAGRLVDFEASQAADARRESFIHFHVDEADDPAQRAAVVQALNDILAEVRVSVQDWQPMLARVRDIIAELQTKPPPLASEEIARSDRLSSLDGRGEFHVSWRAGLRLHQR